MSFGFRRMFLQTTFVVLILSELAAAAVAAPILAKPNCPDRCGDVKIPYPFGTTKDCYLNKGFLINCADPSSSPAQPLFGNVVVTNISIDGQLDIMNFISSECFDNSSGVLTKYDQDSYLRVLNFTISNTKNKFVAVGCDTCAFLNAFQNNEPFSIGCTSTCKSLRNVLDGSCSGIGCCQVDIPEGLKNFTLDARSYNNHNDVIGFSPCSYAFVAKREGFKFSPNYLESLRRNTTYPMVLDWAIGDTTCEIAKNQPGYVCGRNSQCYNASNGDGYLCVKVNTTSIAHASSQTSQLSKLRKTP